MTVRAGSAQPLSRCEINPTESAPARGGDPADLASDLDILAGVDQGHPHRRAGFRNIDILIPCLLVPSRIERQPQEAEPLASRSADPGRSLTDPSGEGDRVDAGHRGGHGGDRPAQPALERQIGAEGRRAARELYREALRAGDEQAVAASGGAKQRTEERWLATTVGRIRLWRYRVKTPAGSYCPLDRALGLDAKEASPALREAVCDLALRLLYRQAAEVASRLTGEPLSHLSCWRILLAEGARVRSEDGRLVSSVFELGEAPPEEVPPPSSWWWRPTAPSSRPSRSRGTGSR